MHRKGGGRRIKTSSPGLSRSFAGDPPIPVHLLRNIHDHKGGFVELSALLVNEALQVDIWEVLHGREHLLLDILYKAVDVRASLLVSQY